MDDWEQIKSGFTDITWNFNVTRAAWWGGFFERVVRMLKEKLKISFGKCKWESEIHAISALKTIEAAINFRPLGHVSMDLQDGRPLCAADFLHFKSPYPLKDEIHEKHINTMNLTELKNMHRRHVSKVRKVWRIFQQGYLQELRKYHKQRASPSHVLKERQLVLVALSGQPRIHWPKGRVTKLIYGRDKERTGRSCVRAAFVRNYNPEHLDRNLKKKILSTSKRKQLTPTERLWVSGCNSDQPIRYPVQILIPMEMQGLNGTVEDEEMPSAEYFS
jgi:hypothetical protein